MKSVTKFVLTGTITAIATSIGFCAPAQAAAVVEPHFMVVTWQMPGWTDNTHPTWPQTVVENVETTVPSLQEAVVPECGYFQTDVYKYTTTADVKAVDYLLSGVQLTSPQHPTEPLIKGGRGVAYELINSGECPSETPTPTPTTTSVTPTPTSVTPTPSTTTPTPTKSETTPISPTTTETTPPLAHTGGNAAAPFAMGIASLAAGAGMLGYARLRARRH